MSKMTHGDFRNWLTGSLYRHIEKIQNTKKHLDKPYFIQVQLNPEYKGVAAKNIKNETKDIRFDNKKVMNVRLVLLSVPPRIPQLGTILFGVDNKRGICKCLYALPADKPHNIEDCEDFSTFAAKSADSMNIPVMMN